MKKYILLFIGLININSAHAIPSFFINQGSTAGTSSGVINVASGNDFVFNAQADHSTYCRHRSPATNGDVNFSPNVGSVSGIWSTATARLVGDIGGGADYTATSNDAISFTAPINDGMVVTLDTVSPSPSNLIIECINTTLFGNFNTVNVANPFNFLEITNDTSSSANALVVIRNNAGTELSRFTVALNPYQQRDISIHDIAGASNTFGSILVSHDSIPHGVRANITKYRLSGSSFVITATSPLETRQNEL